MPPIHGRRAGRAAGRGRSSPTAATTTTSAGGLLRPCGITPHIARCGVAHGSGLRSHPWDVERSFGWLHAFKRLRARYERRADIRLGLIQLACALICYRPPPPF